MAIDLNPWVLDDSDQFTVLAGKTFRIQYQDADNNTIDVLNTSAPATKNWAVSLRVEIRQEDA